MVKYECKLCNYNTIIRQHYCKHIKSKKHKINNGELSGIVVFGCSQNGVMSTNEHKYSTNEHKYSTNEHKYSTNEQKYSANSRPVYYCGYCGNDFSTKPNMMRHERNFCKILKKEEKDEKERQYRKEKDEKERQEEKEMKKKEATEILELKLVVKEQTKQISKLIKKVGNTNNTNNTTNNTNNSNNTTNIILNSYGKEDLSHITNSLKTLLLKGPFKMIPKLIEEIHFNKEKPENKNITYPNKKNNTVKIFRDGEWKYYNKGEFMDELMADSYYILDIHYDEKGDNVLNEVQKKRYRKFKDKYDNGELDKDTKGDINLILLNG
jgi:hypothetical protein